MRPCTFLARCLALAAMLFVAACGSDGAQTCLTHQDCAPAQYCAQSGGVFFSSSRCLDRSLNAAEDVHDDVQDAKDAEDEEDEGYKGNEEDTGLSEHPDVFFMDTAADDPDAFVDTDELQPGTCTQDDDCAPPEDPTTSSACAFETICAISGTQTITTRTSRCENNLCVVHETTTTEACTRPAPTGKCKENVQSWSLCEAPSPQQFCSLTGVQYLSTTTWACEAGQCKPTKVTDLEPQACDRITDGLACTFGGYSGTCVNGCCDVDCPPGKHCLQCMLQ